MPGIGEFIAVPASVAAIILGLVGLRQYETGRSASVAPAAAGAALGALAVVAVLVVALADRT